MKKKSRLSGEERRESILRAVGAVFAENGFRGTTTRALADSAGVSEALLFKHFPSKEALYAAVQASFTGEHGPDRFGQMTAAEPSTATLVRIIHAFYTTLLPRQGLDSSSGQAILARLMFRSVMEDGEFARLFLRRVTTRVVAKIEECILEAARAGDLVEGGRLVPPGLAAWFTHHVIVMLMLNHLHEPPIVDYGATPSAAVEQAVQFALRGIGLKEDAILRHYRPEEWSRKQL